MTNATKRIILRSLHLVLSIPVLGVIYDPNGAQYAPFVRYTFVPALLLSGYWMWSGLVFAIIGVALWLGAFYFVGFGTALLGQVALLIARKIWLVMRARKATTA